MPAPAPEDTNSSIAIVLQQIVTKNVREQVENALTGILELVEEEVEQLLGAATLNAQCGIHTVVYDAVEHVLLIKSGPLGLSNDQ